MNNNINNPMEKSEEKNTGTGFLKVNVSTAGGTIPIEGATVYIRNYEPDSNDGILYSLRTDSSGMTESVPLEAPISGGTMQPGAAQPFAYYNVEVMYDGYHPAEYIGIPIFDGITALQPVILIPYSETERISGYGPPVQIFENNNSYSNLTSNNTEKPI